jgi:hypothetical protein
MLQFLVEKLKQLAEQSKVEVLMEEEVVPSQYLSIHSLEEVVVV